MAKLEIDFPLSPEKLKPNKRAQRRFSTGNSIIKINEQRPIPNYLRASIGSCHDICKYGRAEQIYNHKTESILLGPEVGRSKPNHRGRKVLDTKNSVPVPSTSRKNGSGRGNMRSTTPTADSGSLAKNIRTTKSKVKVPEKIIHVIVDHNCPKNIRTSKTSNLRRKPSLEVKVPEKIIHVIEDHNCPDGKSREKALETKNGVACTRDGEVNVFMEGDGVGYDVTKQLEKTNSETAPKLAKMTRTKVKALVDAFETLINIQDSPSSTRFVGIGVENTVLTTI